MPTEKVKDNQWWFRNSELYKRVIDAPYIELVIGGRRCMLQRSKDGSDGRPTYSFRFLRNDDRSYWRSLNGNCIEIELQEIFDEEPSVETDTDDEYLSEVFEGDLASDGELPTGQKSNSTPEYDPMDFDCLTPASIRVASEEDRKRRLFDAYIFIDWSANNRPKSGRDSIWISEAFWNGDELIWPFEDGGCINPRTRHSAMLEINQRLDFHTRSYDHRVLVCFDFAYGYPACEEFRGLADSNESFVTLLNQYLIDNPNNSSNRFDVANVLNGRIGDPSGEGPFWGRPNGQAYNGLNRIRTTMPLNWRKRGGLLEYRAIETRLRAMRRRAFSVWQLYGNGSVGSQVLLGLPKVFELFNRYRDISAIWPFHTGWVTRFEPSKRIIHAEFWPGAIEVDLTCHDIRDAAQVESCVKWAADQDQQGQLGSFFDPLAPDDADRPRALSEGWILGFVDR